jgi:hypothetical protein
VTVWMALIVVPVLLLVVEVLKLRRRVAYLEKGRDVVQRHLDRLYWITNGSPQPEASDLHVVWAPRPRPETASPREPPRGSGRSDGGTQPIAPRRRPGTDDDGT